MRNTRIRRVSNYKGRKTQIVPKIPKTNPLTSTTTFKINSNLPSLLQNILKKHNSGKTTEIVKEKKDPSNAYRIRWINRTIT